MAATRGLRLIASDVRLAWAEACGDFCEEKRLQNLSAGTVAQYRHVLEPFGRDTADALGHQRPEAVTDADVRRFLAWARGRGAGARGRNHIRDHVRRFHDWLRKRGYTDHNPVAGIDKVREGTRLLPELTEERVASLLASIDTDTFAGLRDRLFVLILLDTGLRLTEALSVRVNDELREGVATVIGKGNKERRVGLSPRLLAELRPCRRYRQAALEGIDRADSPWLFPNDHAERALGPGGDLAQGPVVPGDPFRDHLIC